jgi:hypothetical protein
LIGIKLEEIFLCLNETTANSDENNLNEEKNEEKNEERVLLF